ncbi:MAG: hypothetical protein V3U60_02495 [Gammaproteobacteria bacterium]
MTMPAHLLNTNMLGLSTRILTILVLLGVISAPPSMAAGERYDPATASELVDDPDELNHTWEKAWLHIPRSALAPGSRPILGPVGATYVQERLRALPHGIQAPVVVFMHGCTGISLPEGEVEKILTSVGYAVIFPNSFARTLRPTDCDGRSGDWGMFPLVDSYRRAELINAVNHVRGLPWVDQGNVFLGGFGEGAVSTALWGGQVDVAGYIILGWTCTAPAELDWLGGLYTPADRPVLAVVSRNDPRYGRRGFQGDCGSQSAGRDNVFSHVIDGSVHNVLAYPETTRALLDFLLAHTRF